MYPPSNNLLASAPRTRLIPHVRSSKWRWETNEAHRFTGEGSQCWNVRMGELFNILVNALGHIAAIFKDSEY